MKEMETRRTNENEFIQTVDLNKVISIMKAYDASSSDYQQQFGFGDPMESLRYIVYEVSEVVENYFHQFIQCTSMGRDCVTLIQCSACGNVSKHCCWARDAGIIFVIVYRSA